MAIFFNKPRPYLRKKRTMQDRRKHQRFELHDSCIIHHANIVGTIIDISMGGFACMCLDQDNCIHHVPAKIDIYCRKHDLWAQDITIRVLGSKTHLGEVIPEFGTRTCRIRFGRLNENQLAAIESIIVRHSVTGFS